MSRIAKASLAKIEANEGDQKFYKNKILTARFYMERILPESISHLEKLKTGAETMMAMDAEDF